MRIGSSADFGYAVAIQGDDQTVVGASFAIAGYFDFAAVRCTIRVHWIRHLALAEL